MYCSVDWNFKITGILIHVDVHNLQRVFQNRTLSALFLSNKLVEIFTSIISNYFLQRVNYYPDFIYFILKIFMTALVASWKKHITFIFRVYSYIRLTFLFAVFRHYVGLFLFLWPLYKDAARSLIIMLSRAKSHILRERPNAADTHLHFSQF